MRIAATLLLAVLPLLVWSALVHRRNRLIVRERQQLRREAEDPCLVYLQAQQRALDGSLTRLLTRLRDSQGGRGNRYDVPWYLILGEENAGKSSFVSRSDQRFALTRTERSSAQRAGADPNLLFDIDWWVGDAAVPIDPPGEYISQPERPVPPADPMPPKPAPDAGQEEAAAEYAPATLKTAESPGLPAGIERRLWRHMIGWLAQNRSRRPLNGVVLLVDMTKLFSQTEKARRDLAFVLRARLPLYVVMSKFDLLDGFEELFAKLPAHEREEVQGFTFTLASVSAFDTWLEELGKAYQCFIEQPRPKPYTPAATSPALRM